MWRMGRGFWKDRPGLFLEVGRSAWLMVFSGYSMALRCGLHGHRTGDPWQRHRHLAGNILSPVAHSGAPSSMKCERGDLPRCPDNRARLWAGSKCTLPGASGVSRMSRSGLLGWLTTGSGSWCRSSLRDSQSVHRAWWLTWRLSPPVPRTEPMAPGAVQRRAPTSSGLFGAGFESEFQ